MNNNYDISQLITTISENAIHENNKHYWMVRTDDGANYSTFAESGFVALNLRNLSLAHLFALHQEREDKDGCINLIRLLLIRLHEENSISLSFDRDSNAYATNISRLAGQIYRMAYEMKCGDIVLIPSHGASEIKIGRIVDAGPITDNHITDRFSIARKVKWIRTISKKRFDPCLYKALGAHQAISNVSEYSQFIERNYRSYFKLDDKMHYVLTINTESVSARKLSKYVSGILDTAKEISDACGLNIDVDEVEFSINVNSPGKFSFISTVKTSILIIAVATAIGGGTLQYNNLNIRTNGAFTTLVEGINSLFDAKEELREKKAIFDEYMNSLEVKSVEDWNSRIEDETRASIIKDAPEDSILALPENLHNKE